VTSKREISIACVGAWSIFLCAGVLLHSQGPASPSTSVPPAYQDSANELSVAVGKTVVVDCTKPIARVALGLGEIVEVSAVSPTEIVLSGKATGETSLVIWDTHGGRQFFDVKVVAARTAGGDVLDSVRREFRMEFPGQDLKVSLENGNVILRGTAKDLTSAGRAVQLASGAGKVVNLLNVQVPSADPQILLKVRFASVDRNKARQLGANFFNLGQGNTVGGVTTGQFSPPTISGGGSSGGTGLSSSGYQAIFSNEFNILAFLPGLGSGVDINANDTQGLVEVLAQPNVLATNGKQASFLAGGEYPYPVVQGTGGGTPTVTIQFKQYGVRLNFIATITPRGSIRLQVAPEVSALDFSNAVQVSGFNVPAITSRKVNTEVELNEGQSFVIGGLLDNRETQSFQKIPFIGDIPILGKFFQSMSKNRTNAELIVIVTPEIVSPLPAGAPLPQLTYPEKFLPPNSTAALHHPDDKTADNTPAPPPATLPMEKLIESMRPETPLFIDSATGGFGAATTSAPPAAAAPAPQ